MLLYHTFVFSFPCFFLFSFVYWLFQQEQFYELIEGKKLVDNDIFCLKDKKERKEMVVCWFI